MSICFWWKDVNYWFQETYFEPQKEEILGSYLHVAASGVSDVNLQVIPRNNRGKVTKKKEVENKDIRTFFNPVARSNENSRRTNEKPKQKIPDLVVID